MARSRTSSPATATGKHPGRFVIMASHAIAFSFFVIGMGYISLMGGIVHPLGLVMVVAFIILLFLLTPEYEKMMHRQRQSRFGKIAIWATTLMMYTALLFLVAGLVQDLLHIPCMGFFGVGNSCLSVQAFELFITFLNPAVYLVVVGIPLVLLLRDRFARK